MRCPLKILSAFLVILPLPGCGADLPTVCTAELRVEVQPRERLLAIGESFTPRVIATTCGGTRIVPLDWTLSSDDSAIAEIVGEGNSITGRSPGETYVFVIQRDGGGSIAVIHVQVIAAQTI
jgi:hypothetical protein